MTQSRTLGLAVLALVCGALLPLSMAPFDWWPLALVSAGGLFLIVERFPDRAPLLGAAFGIGKYGVGASWVYVSIHDHGGASTVLAAALVVLFVLILALFPLTQLWTYRALRRAGAPKLQSIRQALVFTVVWVFWEWLLTWVLTGFPWLFAGSGMLQSPFAGFAPVGSVLLVSAAVVFAGALLAAVLAAVLGGRWRAALVRTLALLLVVGLGAGLRQLDWVTPLTEHSVALVQGNIEQHSKWQPDSRERIVLDYERLTSPHWGADLILWPEAAITFDEQQADKLLSAWRKIGERQGSTLVLGLPSVEVNPLDTADYRFRNIAVALGEGHGRYVKRRLVPFGEYVPMESLLRGVITFFDLPMSRAESGAWQQPLLEIGSGAARHAAGMAICYEIAYPGLVNADLPVADVLLTISNDAWFGGSLGPHQHLQIARMRALENGRYLLRATNTGFTAIIDHHGAVLAQLPRFEAGVLAGHYRIMLGQTPFARWGSWPLLAVIVLLLLVMVFLRARARSPAINQPARQPEP